MRIVQGHYWYTIQVYTMTEQLSPLNSQIIISGDKALQKKQPSRDVMLHWQNICLAGHSLWTKLLAFTSSKVCPRQDSKVSQFLLSVYLSFNLSHSISNIQYFNLHTFTSLSRTLPPFFNSPFLFKCSFFQLIASKSSTMLANLINLSWVLYTYSFQTHAKLQSSIIF